MKAIILAAGLGSRLNEITKDKPKALVDVNKVTMLERVIVNLKNQGVNRFLINIHYLGQEIIDFLAKNNNFGVSIIISDERNRILDTGGAILKARDFIAGSESVIVHNVDIISDININEIFDYHDKNNSLATLCIRKRKSDRGLLFNSNMQLVGWANTKKNKYKWVNNSINDYNIFAFSGIYMITPEFVELINQRGKFSIIETWLKLAKNNIISGYIDTSPMWHDLGTVEKIRAAEDREAMR